MKKTQQMLIAILLSSLSVLASAETAVIVAAGNSNGSMDSATISKIFLGKSKSFPDGSHATAVDQADGNPAREAFNDKVLGKSGSQLKSYWSRLIFTGKGTPPKQHANDAAVKAAVAADPNMIGYIDAAAVDGSVKVVGKF
jgi:ABC-type phosphate transport system substrate-binding protein